MPIKVLAAAERKRRSGTVDFCNTHGEGCRKHRYPDPKIWGHRNTDGRGRVKPGWLMTPDEMLDTELDFRADWIDLMGGSRDEFLARSCKVTQMPRAEYRKRFGKPSDEEEKRLRDLIDKRFREDPPEYYRQMYPETSRHSRHTQDVREGYGDAVPDFEEEP
ncbi:hypothetical protein ACWCRF_07270 [Streptomyces sp. NPDC002405]